MIISIHNKLQDSISTISYLYDDWFVFSPLSENIALLKPAWQAHPYDSILSVAGHAVDGGKTNLSIWGRQCTVSARFQTNATWWVNFSSVLSVHHLTIFYRTGNKESGIQNYEYINFFSQVIRLLSWCFVFIISYLKFLLCYSKIL